MTEEKKPFWPQPAMTASSGLLDIAHLKHLQDVMINGMRPGQLHLLGPMFHHDGHVKSDVLMAMARQAPDPHAAMLALAESRMPLHDAEYVFPLEYGKGADLYAEIQAIKDMGGKIIEIDSLGEFDTRIHWHRPAEDGVPCVTVDGGFNDDGSFKEMAGNRKDRRKKITIDKDKAKPSKLLASLIKSV